MGSRSDFAANSLFNPSYNSRQYNPVKNSYYPKKYTNKSCRTNDITFPGSSEYIMQQNAGNYLPFTQNEKVVFPNTKYPKETDILEIGPKDYADKESMSAPGGFVIKIDINMLLIVLIAIVFLVLCTQIIQLRTQSKLMEKIIKRVKL